VLETAMDLEHRCIAELQAGRDYEAVLEAPRPMEKLLPAIFVAMSSARIWLGLSPKILTDIWRRADLKWDLMSALILLWALWGTVSPRSLRWFLRATAALRDRRAARWIKDAEVYEWRFGEGASQVARSR
jgi:hypothetical protein